MRHIEMSQDYTLMISPTLMNEIAYLHSKNDNKEWCGMLFYEEVSGSLFENDLILRAKHIYLMDIGSSAYTEGSVDLGLLDFFDDVPEAEDMKRGFIHTHHGMKAYFSSTDMSELYDNTKHYDYYLSLIVNHSTVFCSKIGMAADIEANGYTIVMDNAPILTFDGNVEFDIPTTLAARQIELSNSNVVIPHKNTNEIFRDTPFEEHEPINQMTIFDDSGYKKNHELDIPEIDSAGFDFNGTNHYQESLNNNKVFKDTTGKTAEGAVKMFIGMETNSKLCSENIIDCLKQLVVLNSQERDVLFDTGVEEDLFNSMVKAYNISEQNTAEEIQSIRMAADEMFNVMAETFPDQNSLHDYPFIQEVIDKMFEEVASLTF